jgi:hypothetical protein
MLRGFVRCLKVSPLCPLSLEGLSVNSLLFDEVTLNPRPFNGLKIITSTQSLPYYPCDPLEERIRARGYWIKFVGKEEIS